MDVTRFEELVTTEQPGLLALAWSLTGDPEAAHDLVQDALVRAYVKRHLLGRATYPRAYLRTLLLNVWRSRPTSRERASDNLPVRGVHDEHHLERRALLEALDDLPTQQRLVVALRHLDDLSVRQTAEALGCSEQTVTTQCARALARLRENPTLADLLEA